ncbi:MAG: DNA-binding transcriptional MerR regulator [Pseudorhodobacter sp.]|jgi:DNA-binding transcriptional MerR regulator
MEKSPDAFRTISEVAELLETPAHVLRFWESRFPQIKPVKRAGGRRYYRPSDVDLLTGIRRLLHEDGLTIRGVQKILREQGVRHVSGLAEGDEEAPITIDAPLTATPEPAASSVLQFPRANAQDIQPEPEPEDDLFTGNWLNDQPTPEPAQPPTVAQSDSPEPEPGPEPTAPITALTEPDDLPADTAAELPDDQPLSMVEHDAPAIEAAAKPPSVLSDSIVDEALGSGESVSADPIAEVQEPSVAADLVAATADESAPESLPAPVAETVVAPKVENTVPEVPPSFGMDEIQGHWLPAELRSLRANALVDKRVALRPLVDRLEVLRERVAKLGRVPSR